MSTLFNRPKLQDELTRLMPTICKIKQRGYLGGIMADPLILIDPNSQPIDGGGEAIH